MFKKFKKVSAVILGVSIFSSTLFLSPDPSLALSGNEPTYTYWKQDSGKGNTKVIKTSYSKFKRYGSAFIGPINATKTISSTTTYTITNSAELSARGVSAGLSNSISRATIIADSVIVKVPKGKVGRVEYREKYKHYKVRMRKWLSQDGKKSKMSTVKYVTIKKKVEVQARVQITKK